MEATIIKITTDNCITIDELEVVNGSILSGLQKIVGGYIEVAHPKNLQPPYLLVCNEEGRSLRLPPNLVASCLYGALLFGDVAVVTETIREGEPDIDGIQEDALLDAFTQILDVISAKEDPNNDTPTNH